MFGERQVSSRSASGVDVREYNKRHQSMKPRDTKEDRAHLRGVRYRCQAGTERVALVGRSYTPNVST